MRFLLLAIMLLFTSSQAKWTNTCKGLTCHLDGRTSVGPIGKYAWTIRRGKDTTVIGTVPVLDYTRSSPGLDTIRLSVYDTVAKHWYFATKTITFVASPVAPRDTVVITVHIHDTVRYAIPVVPRSGMLLKDSTAGYIRLFWISNLGTLVKRESRWQVFSAPDSTLYGFPVSSDSGAKLLAPQALTIVQPTPGRVESGTNKSLSRPDSGRTPVRKSPVPKPRGGGRVLDRQHAA